MKKILCVFMLFVLAFSILLNALAEENNDDIVYSEEELHEMEEEQKMAEEADDSEPVVTGEIYHEKTKEDFDNRSKALYVGKLDRGYSIYAEKDKSSKKLLQANHKKDVKVEILYVGLKWMIVRKDKKIGYVKREGMIKNTIEAVDPKNTPQFNVQKHNYIATTATTCHVRKSMAKTQQQGDDGNNYVILNPGTEISIWEFYNGWAVVNYQREYGYIDPNELKDLIPVAPTDDGLYPDCPIAAYTSYYNMKQTETNINRIHNIKTGCKYISRVLQPGETFDANKVMGPYNARKGYKQAGVLAEGTTRLGYGGGTCQVSSTLYNVLIQLPGIEIKKRRPHGGSGASYLPIHCDAAVGNQELNLVFTNEYDFPIEIIGTSYDDGALLVRIYRDHRE